MVATHLEKLEKSGNLTLFWEKSGELGKVLESVVCLLCATGVAIVTNEHNLSTVK